MQARSLRLTAFGLDHLALTTNDVPAPGPHEVLVALTAAGLNYRDLMVVLGLYNPRMELPRTLGSDAAGTVIAVGSAVTLFKPGDRVATLFFQDWLDGPIAATTGRSALGGTIDGAFTTARLFPETGLIHVPAHLTDAEAATLPCAALTAWNALVEKGRLSAGQTVLVLGTGGVSLFALQIAKLHGARVIVTSSSDAKLERARALGADETVNYRTTPAWDKAVKDFTGGLGADHVVEVGGANTLALSASAAAVNGSVCIIGVLSGTHPDSAGPGLDPRQALVKSLNLHGVYVGSRAMFARMNAAFALAKTRPVIDCTFPLAEARAALSHIEGGSHFGKVVLDLR